MSRQFRSDDSPYRWTYGFGFGTYDATFGTEVMSWNGSTRFGAYGSITGTAGQTSFVKPVGWGHAGFCLLHQTRGTGAGAWELAYVDFSGASAVSDKPLQNTYSTGAQVVTLSNGRTGGYNNVTISGTLTPPAWNGSTGGIIAIMARGTVSGSGTINVSGYGYVAGSGANGTTNAQYAEGTSGGVGTASSANPNGNGGGGSINASGMAGGGGGGNGSAGGNGVKVGSSVQAGIGGNAVGNAGLTSMVFGGGGGGGVVDGPGGAVGGGAGSGIIFIFAPTLTLSSATLNLNGVAGTNTNEYASGGGGAGGSCLLKCRIATLGTNRIVASGGAGGVAQNPNTIGTPNDGGNGGAGGSGRIHLDYSTSYSGSTSPTIDVTQDLTLKYPVVRRSVV